MFQLSITQGTKYTDETGNAAMFHTLTMAKDKLYVRPVRLGETMAGHENTLCCLNWNMAF